uniref:J domain-containing protein n=1 Tax=Neobodo designis TaxID=312471 RepID=A0A7S1PYQ8_NEODS
MLGRASAVSQWTGRQLPPACVWVTCQVRRLSQEAMEASRSIPKTPDGHNPYKVLEVDLKLDTTLDDVKEQFKKMAIKVHPDAKGGSNEAMAEVNAAHKLVKQHHNEVLRALREQEAMPAEAKSSPRSQARRRRPSKRGQDSKEEELARTGGVASTQKVRDMNQRKWRNTREIEEAWSKLKDDTGERTAKMMTRFEVAMEHCEFFRETSMATEVTVKERWLRKNFCKVLWEDIHEMRTDLLKRGTRNIQQQELAEEMVSFATATQKKLNEDFSRQAQRQIKAQGRIFLERFAKIVFFLWVAVYSVYAITTGYWRNSMARSFKPGFVGA